MNRGTHHLFHGIRRFPSWFPLPQIAPGFFLNACQMLMINHRKVGSAGSGDIWDGGRSYRVVGQICQDCAPTECILLLGGERAWDGGNGGSAAAEINPAGGVYFSEEGGAHRQRKRT